MSDPQYALFFRAHVRTNRSLDALADLVARRTGLVLTETHEPGLTGDYLGHALGMELHLHVSYREKFDEAPRDPSGTVFVLEGHGSAEDGRDVEWTDASGYVAEWLRRTTGVAWSSEHPVPCEG